MFLVQIENGICIMPIFVDAMPHILDICITALTVGSLTLHPIVCSQSPGKESLTSRNTLEYEKQMVIQAALQFVTNALFDGSLLLISLLFVGYIFKLETVAINQSQLFQAAKNILLLGCVICLLLLLIFLVNTCFGGEYDRYSSLNRLFGPYWFAYWIFTFLPCGLLPQLLWFRRFRLSISASFLIVVIWGLLTLITMIPEIYMKLSLSPGHSYGSWAMSAPVEITSYLQKIGLYVLIVGSVYSILNRRSIGVDKIKS